MNKDINKKKDSKICNLMLMIKETIDRIHLSEDIEELDLDTHLEFLHIFDDVKDFRDPMKIKFKLRNILLIVLLYVLSTGEQSIYAIPIWAQTVAGKLEKYEIIRNGEIPSHDTFRRIIMLADAGSIRETVIDSFHAFLLKLEKEAKSNEKMYSLINVDGQEFKGSGRADTTNKPVRNYSSLNIYSAGMYLNIQAEIIPEKINEIPIAQDLLSKMCLKGVIVTADALHCQKSTCDIIRKKKGHYVIAVKDNQPILVESINKKINDKKHKVEVIERENRIFRLYSLPSNYARDGFTGLQTFVCMESLIRNKKCIRYFISSLKDKELICDAIEERWSVENDLHRAKDMLLDEDYFRISHTNACKVMGAINDIALAIMKMYQIMTSKESLKEAKLWFHTDPFEATRTMLAIKNSDNIIDKLKEGLIKK